MESLILPHKIISNPFSNKVVFFGNSITDKNHSLRQMIGNCAGVGTKFLDYFNEPVTFLVTEDYDSDTVEIYNYLIGNSEEIDKVNLIEKKIKSLLVISVQELHKMLEIKHNGGENSKFKYDQNGIFKIDFNLKGNQPLESRLYNELNFVAIDFETANNFRRSACSLGLVKVKNGEIVERRYWLIKPTPFEMGYYQKQVHKINLIDLVDEREFHEIWIELKPYLENQLVVAHNGSFDFSVLSHLLAHFNLEPINYSPVCSLQLSRFTWIGELAYGLSYLAKTKLENLSFTHHDALEDAEVCAKIFMKIIAELNISDEESLMTYSYKASSRRKVGVAQRSKKTYDGNITLSETNTFFESEVVITGTLEFFTRKEALAIITQAGGIPTNTVTNQTKFLVTGQQDMYKVGNGLKSSKVIKAEQLAQKGYDIQLINEREFIEMLSI